MYEDQKEKRENRKCPAKVDTHLKRQTIIVTTTLREIYAQSHDALKKNHLFFLLLRLNRDTDLSHSPLSVYFAQKVAGPNAGNVLGCSRVWFRV